MLGVVYDLTPIIKNIRTINVLLQNARILGKNESMMTISSSQRRRIGEKSQKDQILDVLKEQNKFLDIHEIVSAMKKKFEDSPDEEKKWLNKNRISNALSNLITDIKVRKVGELKSQKYKAMDSDEQLLETIYRNVRMSKEVTAEKVAHDLISKGLLENGGAYTTVVVQEKLDNLVASHLVSRDGTTYRAIFKEVASGRPKKSKFI